MPLAFPLDSGWFRTFPTHSDGIFFRKSSTAFFLLCAPLRILVVVFPAEILRPLAEKNAKKKQDPAGGANKNQEIGVAGGEDSQKEHDNG